MSRDHHVSSLAAFLALATVCTGLFLWMCAPYVLPVVMGEILALLLLPAHRRFSKRLPERLSSAVCTIGLLLLVIAPFALFATLAVRQGADTAKSVAAEGGFGERVTELLGRAGHYTGQDPDELRGRLRESMQSGAKGASVAALAAVKAVPRVLLLLALSLLSCYFFILDGGRLPRRLLSRLPIDEDLRLDLHEAIRSTAVATLRAGLAAATAQSLVLLAAFLVLGIPAAFLAAGVTFVCAWIPMVGVIPATVGGAAYLISQSAWGKLAGFAAFFAVASTIDNVVRPMVLRGAANGSARLHPLLSLVAIFGGIQLAGLFGVFVGPVLAALVTALYEVWPKIAARYGIRLGPEATLSAD